MKKIRTIISYDDIQVTDKIANYIKDLEFVDVIAKTVSSEETYNKIVELKPDMVFIKYDFSGIKVIDLIENLKKKLLNETPLFNLFVSDKYITEIEEHFSSIGKNINASWPNVDFDWIKEVLEEYEEYKNQENF